MYENHTWTANVVTLFPEMFPGALSYSLIGKALKNNLWNLKTFNLREFASDKRKTIDRNIFNLKNKLKNIDYAEQLINFYNSK